MNMFARGWWLGLQIALFVVVLHVAIFAGLDTGPWLVVLIGYVILNSLIIHYGRRGNKNE
jgi:hypothetical protein